MSTGIVMPPTKPRVPLRREAILQAAVVLADEKGVAALSMRKLASALGVEAMSLYHHVRNKDALLDGMVDQVFSEIALPSRGGRWRDELANRCRSVRQAMLRHRWALGLMDSRRNPGIATLTHHDAVIGCLLGAGFPIADAAHAFALLDSFVFGFALQETALPIETAEELEEVADEIVGQIPEGMFPHLVTMVGHARRPGYSFGQEFEPGLTRILDVLEGMLSA